MSHYDTWEPNTELPFEEDSFFYRVQHEGGGVSFSVDTSAVGKGSAYYVWLPEDIDEAQAAIDAQFEKLRRQAEALAMIPARLEMLFETSAHPDISFSHPGSASLKSPEEDLAGSLGALDDFETFGIYGAGDAFVGAQQQWRAFLGQIRTMLRYQTKVATEIGGVLVGYTMVDPDGDMRTVWAGSGIKTTAQTASLHTQVIELALRTRMLSLQLLNVVSTGAAKLAPLVAVPGGDVVLIPVVWRFARDVMKALQQTRD